MNRFLVCLCSSNKKRYVKLFSVSEYVEWVDVSVPDSTVIYFFIHSNGKKEEIEKSFLSVKIFEVEMFGLNLEDKSFASSTKVDYDTVYIIGVPLKNGCITDVGFIPFDDGKNKIGGYNVVIT